MFSNNRHEELCGLKQFSISTVTLSDHSHLMLSDNELATL